MHSLLRHRQRWRGLFLQYVLQGMVDFSAHAEAFTEAGSAYGHDHAFLDVHVVVCVGAAIHDVHHRYRQVMGIDAAQVLVEGKAGGSGCCMGSCQGYAQNGVGPKAALVFGAVQVDEDMVQASLVAGIPAKHGIGDFAVHIVHSFQDSLAVVAALVAVPEFGGFKHAGGGTGGNGGSGKGAVFQCHFYFNCGVSPGIQNFSCM